MNAWSPSSIVPSPSHSETERPYKCTRPGCFLRFKRKFTLKEHLKTHTGEKPFVCPVEACGKKFATSGNLTRHIRLHPWLTPLMCLVDGCDRSFSSEVRLEEHLKRHFRGPPEVQVCPIAHCHKQFSTAGNLTRHFKHHHHELSLGEATELRSERLSDVVDPTDRQANVFYQNRVYFDMSQTSISDMNEVSDMHDDEDHQTNVCCYNRMLDALQTSHSFLNEASDVSDATDAADGQADVFCHTRMYFEASRAINPLMNEVSDVTDEELVATLECLF